MAKGEPGGDTVSEMVRQSSGNVFIHAINAFEVAYKLVLWGFSEEAAWRFIGIGGAIKVDDAGDYVGHRALRLKITAPHLSLGDCFCIALAEDLDGFVLTSDGGFERAKTDTEIVMIR